MTATEQAREQQAYLLNPDDRDFGLSDLADATGGVFEGALPTEWLGQLDVWWVRAVSLALWALLLGGWLLALARGSTAARFFGGAVALGYAVFAAALLSADWPARQPRYLYPVLPALAVAVAAALPGRAAWRAVAVASALTAALWVDGAGAFYFTDVGDALGI